MYATEVYNMLRASAKASRDHAATLSAKAAELQLQARKHDENAAYHTNIARQYESLAVKVDQANAASSTGNKDANN